MKVEKTYILVTSDSNRFEQVFMSGGFYFCQSSGGTIRLMEFSEFDERKQLTINLLYKKEEIEDRVEKLNKNIIWD
jgi:hypothetical protein